MQIPFKPTALAIALACLVPAGLAFAAEPQAAPAAAETTVTTPGGRATFLLPQGWASRVQGNAVIVTPPEADGSRSAFVDTTATDVDAAVAEAWKVLGLDPKFLLATDAAPRDGWDQRRFYDYDIPANAKRVVNASAFRKGKAWTVVVADVDQAIAEKRGSQYGKIAQRFQPAGYARETFAGRAAHKLDAAPAAGQPISSNRCARSTKCPAWPIGIVQDGKVVMSRGFGVRELGKPAPVDGDTRFMIASNTKALTTLMLAKLVDAGKLDWNARAEDVYPAFKLGDAATTDKVLVKHLICACTGLPRQDMEWLFEGEKQTPETVMTTLGTMQPTSGFGELFQYSNPMAAAAGYIGGQVAYPGERTRRRATTRRCRPWCSTRWACATPPSTTPRRRPATTPRRTAYDIDHKVEVMDMGLNDTIVASRPAGAAWGTVNDLLRYVQMEIGRGVLPDGTRYIGEAALLQRREPQIALGVDRNYAMALMVDKSDGVTVVDHGGDMGGFHSNMMWWPEQKVGAVILTNADEGVYLRGPFKRRLMELMFDGEAQAQATADANAKANREGFDAFRKLLQIPGDAAALAALAPRYRNDALGDIVVSRRDGKARIDVGAFSSEIVTQPQPDGSLAFVTIDPVAAGFQFWSAPTRTACASWSSATASTSTCSTK
jgi:CubicO group peptidase (beta-lactamase class C family)